ncbi:putative integral membrane protein [Corynebacterium renale]|uniref:Uncharacterized membrane protein (DUF485 family) n=2 Tax=Corynebacterium renale TaxID=1724 RepID=A0A2A9DM21_9CORY|nr:uncharacterized membrane protein (DUF485 family) [Corynebacterium renale]SQI24452.1 putative integral membrane protein [Corynebacterium renale]
MSTTDSAPTRRQPTAAEFQAMQKSPQFQELRSVYRRFTFPAAIGFFLWFVFYVVAATYFPNAMGITIYGSVNVGVALGLAQFLTTFIITWAYVKYANKNIEPRAAAIRAEMEGV